MSSVRDSELGLLLENGDVRILLDPMKVRNNDFVFVSHAHSDHVYRKPRNKIRIKTLTSKETEAIAKVRGYVINNPIYEEKELELINTSHILGSRGLLAFNEIYYTGDISIRHRAFMKPPEKLPGVDTLIIEATFGKPEYVFPDHKKIIHDTNKIIANAYERGQPVILMGYQLGKAQLLTYFFSHWDPFYVHDSIYTINSVYREMGISLRETVKHSEAEKEGILGRKNPWIMLTPLMNGKSKFIENMKEKYNVITIGFSGWACNTRYRKMMDLDYAMPLSDHCDYGELIHVVEKCNPKKIFTFHGFAEEFARSLRNLGYDAEPISYMPNRNYISKKIKNKEKNIGKNDNLNNYIN